LSSPADEARWINPPKLRYDSVSAAGWNAALCSGSAGAAIEGSSIAVIVVGTKGAAVSAERPTSATRKAPKDAWIIVTGSESGGSAAAPT
jgi:hypothetical protein